MEQFWHKGQLKTGASVTLSLTEPGWLYGATVFTTLRVYETSLDHPLTAWDAHCDRLQSSMCAFGWRSPDWNAVRLGAHHLAEQYPVLRITLFPDGAELITGRSLPQNLAQDQQQGIAAWVAGSEYRRSFAAHKTGNYLPCWLALQEAKRHEAEEAILTDAQGRWLETSTGNLWAWADGSWWTPPLVYPPSNMSNMYSDNTYSESFNAGQTQKAGQTHLDTSENSDILPGVVRSQVISRLKWQNERINELHRFADQPARFETLAYTNSVRQVVPIHTVVEGTALAEQICHRFNVNHPALKRLKMVFE
ncbi:MAG: aminotransferase class IV [Elainellaceae cyanobacterium]